MNVLVCGHGDVGKFCVSASMVLDGHTASHCTGSFLDVVFPHETGAGAEVHAP